MFFVANLGNKLMDIFIHVVEMARFTPKIVE